MLASLRATGKKIQLLALHYSFHRATHSPENIKNIKKSFGYQ